MSCHETLMARRRKRSKQTRMNSSNSNVILDKSLPALPPSAVPKNAFAPTPETETPPSEFYSDTPREMSPRPQGGSRRKDGSMDAPNNRSISPAGTEEMRNGTLWNLQGLAGQVNHGAAQPLTLTIENLVLPASTYGDNRHSYVGQDDGANTAGGDDGFFIPMQLDPNPAPGPSPMTANTQFDPLRNHTHKASIDKDYMGKGGRVSSLASDREGLRDNDSRSSSVDRTRRDGSYNRGPASPHIAYQAKGRQQSSDYMDARSRRDMSMESSPAIDTRTLQSQSSSAYTSQAASPNEFKLQEAPKSRKGSITRKLSKTNPAYRNMTDSQRQQMDARSRDIDISTKTSPISVEPSPLPEMDSRHFERPTRGDSLERPARGDSLGPQQRQAIARKELPTDDSDGPATPRMAGQPAHERKTSTVSTRQHPSEDSQNSLHGTRSISKPTESDVAKSALDVPNLPARSTSRPNALLSGNESFTAPRAPPPPPAVPRHKTNESISTIQSNMSAQLSPTLPRYSSGGDFSLEEEMGRILKGEQIDERDQSVLRKVSNAAKHMRSFSDRGAQATTKLRDHQFVRSPSVTNGSVDLSSIGSPTSVTPDGKNEVGPLKTQLRRMQKRNAELEAERNHLMDMLNNNQDVKAVNEDLKQKRSTMAFLDTQREIVVRELEVMTEHLKKAKETNQPLDVNQLKSDIMRDFGSSLLSLKDDLSGEIEDLIHKRNEITNEIADLIQLKDRGNQEYEDLSHRNQQLTSLNSELVSQIQKMHEGASDKGKPSRSQHGLNGSSIGMPFIESRSASSNVTSPNGLGIYNSQQSQASGNLDPARTNSNDPSLMTLVNEDAEPAVMTAPHVVNIRKGRPNMWKKGSQAVAKNIRGIKGAFASANQYPERPGYGGQTLTEGVPYGSMQEGIRPNNNDINISGPMNVRKGDPAAQYNMFAQGQGKKIGKPMGTPTGLGMGMSNGSGTNVGEAGLFGSDLSQRCQVERRDIPSIVSTCIQEVEIRGMDVEGVYRKSGGSGQVNAVRTGFEKDNNYDVSDPDLDIHAVTSCLKQYFRRLPVPLITFDVYDGLLEAAQITAHDDKVHEMRDCIDSLPKAHRDVLSFLVFHLARVMSKESENLVSLTSDISGVLQRY